MSCAAVALLVAGCNATANDRGEPPQTLRPLPPPPVEAPLAQDPAWTGNEFLFVDEHAAVALDPGAGSWRRLPAPPAAIASAMTSVWTGRELVVCCQPALAYDPASAAWRILPDAPLPPGGRASALWDGHAVVVVSLPGAASFDPATGEWQTIPSPGEPDLYYDLVWTGTTIIGWPSPPTRRIFVGEAYDRAAGRWNALPAPPEASWPAIPDIVWIDDSLVVLGGLPAEHADDSERFVGARYDTATGLWSQLPDPLHEQRSCECNLGKQTSLWTGTELLVHAQGVLLAYDPGFDAWSAVGDMRPVAMAGDRVLLERRGRYFLTDPGWHSTGDPTTTPCEATVPRWKTGIADGLPRSGSATAEAARRLLDTDLEGLLARQHAIAGRVRVDDGRAWRRHGTEIEIVDEPIGTIVLLLADESACPHMPSFDDGVPLTFEVDRR